MPEGEKLTQVFRRNFTAALAVITAAVLIYCVYRLRYVALVVAISGLLAYLLSWPVERLSLRMRRTYAVTIVFCIFLVLLVGLFSSFVPILAEQVQQLIDTIPAMVNHLAEFTSKWRITLFPGHEYRIADYWPNLDTIVEQRTPSFLAHIFNYTQSIVTGTATVLAAIFIIPLLTLYLLIDSARLKRSLIEFFSRSIRADVERAIDAVNRSLGRYIYSRVILALFVGVTTTLVLAIFGVPFAILLGLLAFVGEFIPVIGPWMAFVPTALIVLATDPVKIIVVGIFLILIQMIETYLIVPKLMGDTMDLHPLTVIIAMLIGGTLGGIAGLLVAIPAAAALKVIFGIFIIRRREHGIEVPELDMIDGAPSPAEPE